VNAIQKETIVRDIAREMPKINAALENRKTDHQTGMVKIEGILNGKVVSILIDQE